MGKNPLSTTFVSGNLGGMSSGGSNTSTKTASKNTGKKQPMKSMSKGK